jgi:hypothetical protein
VLSCVEEYLRSVGETTDAQSIKYRLQTPKWPNTDGHFGQVGPITHWKYESMPAPVVLSSRIKEGIAKQEVRQLTHTGLCQDAVCRQNTY